MPPFKQIALVALVGVVGCNVGPDPQGASPLAAAQQAAKGSGGGGGGPTPVVTLPADWPAEVPVPAGALRVTLGASPSWIVALIAEGSYASVSASVIALYTSAGFTQPQGPGMLVFDSPTYSITVAAAARDHSNLQTDVNVYLTRK